MGCHESVQPLKWEMLCKGWWHSQHPPRPLPLPGGWGGMHRVCSLPGGEGKALAATTAQPHEVSGLSHLGRMATGDVISPWSALS